MKGQRYRNKHNGREVTIVEGEMMDTGDMIYKCCDDDTGKIDWTGDYTLKEHWIELDIEDLAFGQSFRDSPIVKVIGNMDRQELLDEICSLKTALKIANKSCVYSSLSEPNDACDTHSQHLNTSGKEE